MNLCAVLTHAGRDFTAGHWEAYAVGGDGAWINYNDAAVEVTAYHDLPGDFCAVSKNCSLLLYKRGLEYKTG